MNTVMIYKNIFSDHFEYSSHPLLGATIELEEWEVPPGCPPDPLDWDRVKTQWAEKGWRPLVIDEHQFTHILQIPKKSD